jgi:transposase
MSATRPAELNRKQRKELARRLRVEDPGLDVMHPDAAGIDVGNSAHYVAVRPDRDPDSVRRFDCFTAELHRLADWLQHCGVTTVAMQSTGVYWIPLYEILDARGFEVYLVNARHTKNLPGRKSDVQESQWLPETPHLRIAAELVSPTSGDSRRAHVLAPTRRPCARRQHVHPTHAEGAHADEHPAGECHQ